MPGLGRAHGHEPRGVVASGAGLRRGLGGGPRGRGPEAPTLGRGGAHQADHPAPQAVPAQHREAEAVGRGRRQARQEEGAPGGVGPEDELGGPCRRQLLRHHQTGVHVPRGHRPDQGQARGFGLALHVLHRVRLCGFRSSVSSGGQCASAEAQRHWALLPQKGTAAAGRNERSSRPPAPHPSGDRGEAQGGRAGLPPTHEKGRGGTA